MNNHILPPMLNFNYGPIDWLFHLALLVFFSVYLIVQVCRKQTDGKFKSYGLIMGSVFAVIALSKMLYVSYVNDWNIYVWLAMKTVITISGVYSLMFLAFSHKLRERVPRNIVLSVTLLVIAYKGLVCYGYVRVINEVQKGFISSTSQEGLRHFESAEKVTWINTSLKFQTALQVKLIEANFRENDYDKAMAHVKKIVVPQNDLIVQDFEFYNAYKLGKLQEYRKSISSALAYSDIAKDQYPILSLIYAHSDRYSDSISMISNAIANDPVKAVNYTRRGALRLYFDRELSEAKSDFLEAKRLTRDDCVPEVYLGIIALKEEKYSEAARAFRTAVDGDELFCREIPWRILLPIKEKQLAVAEQECRAIRRNNSAFGTSLEIYYDTKRIPYEVYRDFGAACKFTL